MARLACWDAGVRVSISSSLGMTGLAFWTVRAARDELSRGGPEASSRTVLDFRAPELARYQTKGMRTSKFKGSKALEF